CEPVLLPGANRRKRHKARVPLECARRSREANGSGGVTLERGETGQAWQRHADAQPVAAGPCRAERLAVQRAGGSNVSPFMCQAGQDVERVRCPRRTAGLARDGQRLLRVGPEAGRVERLCTHGRGWSLNRFEECVKPVARLRWIAMQEPEPAECASQAQADVKRFGVAAIQTPTQGLAEVILLALESRGDGR